MLLGGRGQTLKRCVLQLREKSGMENMSKQLLLVMDKTERYLQQRQVWEVS